MKQKWKEKEFLIAAGLTTVYCLGLFIYAWLSSKFIPADLNGFDYKVPVIIAGIILLLGSLFVVWLIVKKKAEIHQIYLGMAVVIFSVFLWAQPPGHTHDIQFHFDSTYVLSNKLLKQDTEELKVGQEVLKSYYRRNCDTFMPYTVFRNYLQSYRNMQSSMLTEAVTKNTRLVETDTYQGTVSVPLYFYLPQAAGFAIARVLNLNMFWMLYIGRILLCMVCVLLTYFAIKNVPFGKEIFLLCGLIPTTLLSYASISRDALILAVSFYFIAKCLQLVYGEKTGRWWDYCLLFLSLILLVPYKLVYIPFVLMLGLLISKNCEVGKWNKRYIWIAGLAGLLTVGIFVIINFGYLKAYLTGANFWSMGEGAPFTLPYILANPQKAISVVGKTLLTATVRYYANMIAIGDYGGGIHKEMVVVDTLLMIALVLATNRPENRTRGRISLRERFLIIFTWLAISGMIILAYLLCTPYTNDVIIGVQGRYFTPALPLMILTFCNIDLLKRIKNKYWIGITDFMDRAIVKRWSFLGIYGVAVFVVVNMYVYVVTYVAP